jgi:hypothetical protein
VRWSQVVRKLLILKSLVGAVGIEPGGRVENTELIDFSIVLICQIVHIGGPLAQTSTNRPHNFQDLGRRVTPEPFGGQSINLLQDWRTPRDLNLGYRGERSSN